MANAYDIIIIGGGIMGCSSAYQLSQRGLRVGLIEQKNIGDGPTGKSSAIVRQHYSNELTARMALYGLRVFQNFEDRVGGECGFRNCGYVLVSDPQHREGLELNVAMQQSLGVPTEILTAEAAREVMPGMETGDLTAVAYERESGHADPYLTVNSYADAARRHGAEIHLNTSVTGLRYNGDRIAGVDTSAGPMDAPIVINCCGSWASRIAAMAGLDVPINACRVQIAFFRRPAGHEALHPVVADFVNASYFRPETGDLTLVGLVDPKEAEDVVDPDSFNEQADFAYVSDA